MNLANPFPTIGTIRREYLDRTLFWTTADLESKLLDFSDYLIATEHMPAGWVHSRPGF